MFCFLKPSFDAKVKVDNNFYYINKNEYFPVNENYKSITVFGEHTKEAFFVPYVLNEKLCKSYFYKGLNCSIIKLGENLFLKNKGTNLLLEQQNFKAEFLQKGKCFVKITINEHTFIEQFFSLCSDANFFDTNNFLVVYAKNYCEGYSVIIFNKITKAFCFNNAIFKIEKQNNNLFILDYPLNNGTAKTFVYNLNEKNLNLIESFYVEVFKPTNKNYNPIYFFEAVKSENFKLAKSFLTTDMQNVATDNSLKDFFKDYNDIEKNPFKNNNLSYLLINNNEICDISFNINPQSLIDNFDKN